MNLKKMREDNLEEKILSITNNQELKLILLLVMVMWHIFLMNMYHFHTGIMS